MYTTLHLNFNPVNLQPSNYNQAFSIRVENRVGPDLMALSDLDLQCFQKKDNSLLSTTSINSKDESLNTKILYFRYPLIQLLMK